jgi:hypothetical protein
VESEIFIESFLWYWLGLVKIDDLPSLVSTIVSLPVDYCLSFNIFTSFNIKTSLVLPIDDVLILIGEDLPPSRACAPDLHVF